MHTLVVESGKHKGKKITLPEQEAVIGRDEGCFIRMASGEVSRRHCALVPTDRGVLVRDLDSQNGTLVNDARIEGDTLLQPGDLLQIGPIQFRLSGARPAKEPGTMSDDEIAGWLSDADMPTDILNSSDTTVIKPIQPPAPPPKPKFKTVAEEARDIIRRHRESVAGP